MLELERTYYKSIGLSDQEIARLEKYPHGIGYDNLFNAEHRDLMIEKHGGTSAAFVTIQELINSV